MSFFKSLTNMLGLCDNVTYIILCKALSNGSLIKASSIVWHVMGFLHPIQSHKMVLSGESTDSILQQAGE